MKKARWPVVAVVALAGMLVSQSRGQVPVIKSFQGNGRLAWTNTVNTNAIYRLEWASQAGGPWHSFTYQPMNAIDAHGSASFEAQVPMFYRVVMTTNQPPQGMVWIDGGDVVLGQTSVSGLAVPVHTNFISGFWIDEMEVTKAQWDAVAGWATTKGYDIAAAGGLGKTNNHPVHTVNWYECVKWCNARSQKEGLTPSYYIDPIYFNLYKTGTVDVNNAWVNWSANGYRLPTEAEWEKAARGGRQQRLFPWGGDTIQHARANYKANTNNCSYDTSPTEGYHPAYAAGGAPYTSPVGSFPANGYGLHDTTGNVWEWCWDWISNYTSSYDTNPRGPTNGMWRTIRGGSWQDTADFAPCAFRGYTVLGQGYETNDIGFRCARGP